MNVHLIDTIREDCRYWGELVNQDRMCCQYLTLQECAHSEESRLYQLVLNGRELWYGTLAEINAVVKTMIYQIEQADKYGL